MTSVAQRISRTDHPPFLLGEIRIDPPALSIERDGETLRIEPKSMEVLLALAREPGRVVSRQRLEQAVWPGRIVTDDTVTNAVIKLRKALHDNPRQPQVIETISKSGYRLMIDPLGVTGDTVTEEHPVSATRGFWGLPAWLLPTGLLLIVVVVFLTFLDRTDFDKATTSKTGNSTIPSIAVMPFDVLGENPSQTYFAEGLTLDLITDLSRLHELLIIAPGTVFGYRETTLSDHEIASELGVRYLIRGGVQRMNNQLRINARLLEAAVGQTLWAERFEGEIGSVFQIQDEVVSGIISALRPRLSASKLAMSRRGATGSIAAYDEFLRGLEYYGRRTPHDNRLAQTHFERAIALDPTFARAYAGVALAWSRRAIDGWTDDAEKALSKAEEFADKAASIDRTVPQIHFVRGQLALFRGQHDDAAAAALTAIELDPNYADAHALLAWILHYAGRPDQAWPALGEAEKRNPNSSASYREIAGEIYFTARNYYKAVQEFNVALERNPAHMRARLWLAASLLKLGQNEDAVWEVQELLAIHPDFSLEKLFLSFPLKDPRQQDALTEALTQLGLPK